MQRILFCGMLAGTVGSAGFSRELVHESKATLLWLVSRQFELQIFEYLQKKADKLERLQIQEREEVISHFLQTLTAAPSTVISSTVVTSIL
jgi:hypothetical protein